MGKYKIEFTKRAAKDYKKLHKDYKFLVDVALSKLSDGLPLDVKPIIGEINTYRIRIGKYRILFININKTFLVIRIASRGEAYKK